MNNRKQTKSDVLSVGVVALASLGIGEMRPRNFSTGSVGLNHSGKVTIKCGEAGNVNCQVGVNITLAHSKPDDPKFVGNEVKEKFLALNPMTLKDLDLHRSYAPAKTFSSGKVGFFLNGKLTIDGMACQLGVIVTAIGSDQWDDHPAEQPEAK